MYTVKPYSEEGTSPDPGQVVLNSVKMKESGVMQVDNYAYQHDSSAEKSEMEFNGTKQRKSVTEKPRRDSRTIRGSTLVCRDLRYTVKVPNPEKRFSKMSKEILRGVNGIFKPGMNAIMGPSGGGKTTLLDSLAGKKDKSCITGTMLMDGKKIPDNFKLISGYVVQDDIVMGTLTVRENIMFSANLRLDSSIPNQEKKERVKDTLRELGLTKCADSVVGNEFLRGVSGGERKRVNIGMELIIEPNVLFLDEPTTGLDASTSNAVMMLLQRLSRKGRTIVFSIHQPRYSIFKLFDRLTLMAAGRTAYHGPAQEALDYFQTLDYECETHNNPPDFFLDVINGDSTAIQITEEQKDDDDATDEEEENDQNNSSKDNKIVAVNAEMGKTLADSMGEKFQTSIWFEKLDKETDPIVKNYQNTKGVKDDNKKVEAQYATNFLVQLKYICKRNITNLTRNPEASVMQFLMSTIFALVSGLVFLRIGDKIDAGIQNRTGMLFFVTVIIMWGNVASVELIIKERTIFLHENSSGFYRTSSFFLGKVLSDVLPVRIISLIPYTLITYFMVGLQEQADKFFLYFFTLFLATMSASAVGFVVGALTTVSAVGNLLVTLIYVIMMIFAGLFVNVDKMGKWLSWLQYVSIARYGLNALSINELNDLTLKSYNHDGSVNETFPTIGYDFLTQQGIKHYSDWDFWQNHMALILLFIGFMILAYFLMRRLKETK